MMARSAIITVMTKAAEKAAIRLVRDFGEVEKLQVSRKGVADFVSQADLKAEETLRAELEKARPGYGFLLEEGGEVKGDGVNRWIIDPLDGTVNFLHGIPHFSISLALEREGEIIAGVILDPVKHELFHAEKGGGAFLNDFRLRVSARRDLPTAVVGCWLPVAGSSGHEKILKQVAAVMPQTGGIRCFGGAALNLAYVAAGRLDGYWEEGLKPWDMAAGMLMVKEAGGYVSDITGGTRMMATSSVVAANDQLHHKLGQLLRKATPPAVKAAPKPEAAAEDPTKA
ncbi:inositol monophosphatase family protein [Elstera cyanobacteriorum]|uniref:inositol monophosphatase family protein n=1 Tax=Elstera cyanobacteriorum TaxID=2022747 RepID=UPI0023564FA2|nr:inositol monophosphatase family protein [Elstera cyanobacteriorum]MCK6442831.1 inositol monophosphatase [Elstera cyanobacteriorum]